MLHTTQAARADLATAAQQGVRIAYTAQGALSERPLRRSSVLVLFGVLDSVPADRAAAPVPADLDVLLTRRADHLRHHPGQIAFPGGGVEAHDVDEAATALREANEETGLDPSGVDVIGTLESIHIPVSNNLVTPVLGWWSRPSTVAADDTESVQVFRVPVAELLDPSARGTSVLGEGPDAFRGPAFQLHSRFGGHIVWGFTGMLLTSLFEGIGWAEPWDANRTFPIAR